MVSAEAVTVPRARHAGPSGTGRSGGALVVDTARREGADPPSRAAPGPSLDEGRNNSARCGRVRLVDRSTGEVLEVACRSWKCPRCAVTNRRAFVKRLRMGLNAPGPEVPKLLTLTSRPEELPFVARERLTRRFAELRRRLSRAFPAADINYAGAVELTAAGRVHFHVVLRGVPFMPQPVWSRLAHAVGFGYIVDVRRVRSADGMGRYLSKSLGSYLTKQAGSGAWPAHFRRIRFSHAWAPGWVPSGRRPRQDGAHAEDWVLLAVTPLGAAMRAWEAAVAGQGPP